MAGIGRSATRIAAELLKHPLGLPAAIAGIAERERVELGSVEESQIVTQNVASEIAERSVGVKYPAIYVYCEGFANLKKEKFRKFSGKAFMVIEVRVSDDRLEETVRQLQYYVEAVTDVLERNCGEWSPGIYYTGGYKAELGTLRHGGKYFVQGAKIRFDLEISVD